MKKKIFLLCMVLILSISTCACGKVIDAQNVSADSSAKTVVNVFAASTMAESLNVVIRNFEYDNREIDIVATYDDSEKLKKQIQKGTSCDIFISDSQEQMDAIDGNSSKCEKDNYVLDGSRINLVENQCVLVLSPEYAQSMGDWAGFDSLIKSASSKNDLKLIVGDSDTSLGKYSTEIFKNIGVNEKKLSRKGIIKEEKDMNKLIEKISSDDVNCGIVYITDAYNAGLMAKEVISVELTGEQILFPVAEMVASSKKAVANDFFLYLQTTEAMQIFESVGLLNPVN